MHKKSRAIAVNELSWSELAQSHPELLERQLKLKLTKTVAVDQLAGEIARILKPLGNKPGTPETVAQHIAMRPTISSHCSALESENVFRYKSRTDSGSLYEFSEKTFTRSNCPVGAFTIEDAVRESGVAI
jgi:hypothetical protein